MVVQRQKYPSLPTRWHPYSSRLIHPFPRAHRVLGFDPSPRALLLHCGFQCKAAAALRSFSLVVSVGSTSCLAPSVSGGQHLTATAWLSGRRPAERHNSRGVMIDGWIDDRLERGNGGEMDV